MTAALTRSARQARIDAGLELITGLNNTEDNTPDFDLLEVDNSAVREAQLSRLARLKAERDPQTVAAALGALTRCAETGEGNLLENAVNAARARATLGEISAAMEKAFGRYTASVRTFSGVYSGVMKNHPDLEQARKLSDDFAVQEGRRPRILVAKVGQDGHDRGARVIATGFADIGFDVDIGPLFQTPQEVARQAVENDVHIVGVSSLAGGHKTLLPELIKALADLGRDDILVVAGGVIPPHDHDFLRQAGVALIFGPGTPVTTAATRILTIMLAK